MGQAISLLLSLLVEVELLDFWSNVRVIEYVAILYPLMLWVGLIMDVVDETLLFGMRLWNPMVKHTMEALMAVVMFECLVAYARSNYF